MQVLTRLALVTIFSVTATAQAAFSPESVSDGERQHWVRHLVPLPRQVELTGRYTVPAGQLAVVAERQQTAAVVGEEGGEALAAQAVKEIAEAAGISADARPENAFTLRLRVDAKAPEFKDLPNADQAYLIRPSEKGDGLELIGGGPRGLYYATKTMQQLLRADRKEKDTGGQAASGTNVVVPAVKITDWPDMQDRGFWGGDSYNHLRWMSDRKLNYDEQISHTGVDRDKKCFVRLNPGKQKIIDEGPTYGINPVPVVLHLEQLSNTGLFEAYPELKGVNGRAGSICYSNPLFVDVLAQWLLLWRAEPGVKEIDVWMAENLAGQKGCQCERCAKEDRSVLEARSIVAAWNKARRTQSDLNVRILTSEETEKANPQVFAELPKDMKIWYYHSLFTYNTMHRPMIRPYLEEIAKSGRWVGVCPNLCANVGCWHPFTGAQFIHARMNEFVDKKLSGFIGYAVPRIPQVRFNAEAAAEWSWNAKGRSPREFAVSYAVRSGYADPEKFADWVEVNGPVAWDIYGSEFPAGNQRKFPGKMSDLVKAGKLPGLGEVLWEIYGVPWGDIKTPEQLERDVKQAERSVQLARELGIPEYLHESMVVQGYANALRALWDLKRLVTADGVVEADKPAAGRAFAAYANGLEQARTGLADWQESLAGESDGEKYVGKPRALLEEMIADMNAVAKELGCAGRE